MNLKRIASFSITQREILFKKNPKAFGVTMTAAARYYHKAKDGSGRLVYNSLYDEGRIVPTAKTLSDDAHAVLVELIAEEKVKTRDDGTKSSRCQISRTSSWRCFTFDEMTCTTY